MGEFVCGAEGKRHIGVFLHEKPSEGGSFQYEEFILDALDFCLGEYIITAVYDNSEWEEILRNRYPRFHKKQILFDYDTVHTEIDSMGFCYLIVPSYGPDHCFVCRFQTPVITSFHDFMYYYEPRGKMWDDKKFSNILQAVCFRAAGVFVDSDMGKQHCLEILGHMYEEKVVPLPFRAPNYLYESEEKKVSLRHEKYIFYPAQLWPHKNHLNLLLAVDLLKEQGIEIHLVFTGKNSGFFGYIIHLIQKLNLEEQIEILDYVNGAEMKYLLCHARAMVMASYAGPTNIPPLEAMLCSCPVAVADIYAMPWQVGEAGLCFDPKSVEDIADTLKLLWEDDELCKKMTRKGRKQIKKFSKDTFNKKFAKGMKKIISDYEKQYAAVRMLVEKCRSYTKVYLYGAGIFGAMIANYLRDNGTNISGFIVTDQSGNNATWCGYKVFSLDEVKDVLTDALVILSVFYRRREDILANLNTIPVKEIYAMTREEWAEAYTYFVMQQR